MPLNCFHMEGLKSDFVGRRLAWRSKQLLVLQQTLRIWALAKYTLNVHSIDSKTVYRHKRVE
jgi:hypothetical protein